MANVIDIKTMNYSTEIVQINLDGHWMDAWRNKSLKVKNIRDAYVHILNSTCTEQLYGK